MVPTSPSSLPLPLAFGDRRGECDFECAGAAELAAKLPSLLPPPDGRRHTRAHVARHEIAIGGATRAVIVKSFARQWWRDGYFARNGSKARRSFALAAHLRASGVGAPRPLAWLDRWQDGRLLECHYVYEFVPGVSFREALDAMLRRQASCREVLALLDTVATAIARMHAAGVCHFDLGNQNVLLDGPEEDPWRTVRFIDLDRARYRPGAGLRLRARDLSRIDIPCGLLSIFHCMYFGHREPPVEFKRWEAHYRRRFALHTATRPLRHPLRALRDLGAAGPPPVRHWMWDERSEQAIGVRGKARRYLAYPWRNALHIARGLARVALPVHRRYRELMAEAFTREVSLAGRIGIGIGGSLGVRDEERALLAGLGRLPALVRLHRHAGDEANGRALAHAEQLRAAGHPVFVALLQDRACVERPALWRCFLETWLPSAGRIAEGVEVGHAVNRVKWGVEDFADYRRMVEEALALASCAPGVRLTGPAVIDFEYHYLAGLLDTLPRESFAALSHHLYVDRRGAPENRQGHFSSVEKFALAKAIAGCSPAVRGERLVVSEVNWPLAGTGAHSPIGAPYRPLGAGEGRGAVDEETYADYMVRYYALALCSGFVEQVYWWRLAAHGFGLVDDAAWRPRPAFAALRTFVALLGDATFIGRIGAPADAWVLRFRKPDGSHVVMAWSAAGPVRCAPAFAWSEALSRDGIECRARAPFMLDGTPMYFVGVH